MESLFTDIEMGIEGDWIPANRQQLLLKRKEF